MLGSLVKQGVWQVFKMTCLVCGFISISQNRLAMKHRADWQNKHTHIAEFLAIKGCTTSVNCRTPSVWWSLQTALKYLDEPGGVDSPGCYPKQGHYHPNDRTLKEADVNCKDQDWLRWKLRWSKLSFWIGRPHHARRHALAVFIALPPLPKTRMHVDSLMLAAHASKWMEGEGEQNIARLRRALDFANLIGSPQLIIKCYEQLGIYYQPALSKMPTLF